MVPLIDILIGFAQGIRKHVEPSKLEYDEDNETRGQVNKLVNFVSNVVDNFSSSQDSPVSNIFKFIEDQKMIATLEAKRDHIKSKPSSQDN